MGLNLLLYYRYYRPGMPLNSPCQGSPPGNVLGPAQHALNGPPRRLPNWVPLTWGAGTKVPVRRGYSSARWAGGHKGCGVQEAVSGGVAPPWAPWGWVGGIASALLQPLPPWSDMHGNWSLRVDPRPSWSQRVTVPGLQKKNKRYDPMTYQSTRGMSL